MPLKRPPEWVRLSVKPEHRDGVEKLAPSWGWRVHRTVEGIFVRVEESSPKKPPRLLVPERIADTRDASSPATWDCVRRWPAQSGDLGMERERIDAEIERCRNADSIAGWWHAIELSVFTAPHSELADVLQTVMTRDITPKYPYASLWRVAVNPVLDRRMAALRALLTEQEAPEVMQRTPFTGFPTGKAMMNGTSLGFETYLEPALMALAPGLLGLAGCGKTRDPVDRGATLC